MFVLSNVLSNLNYNDYNNNCLCFNILLLKLVSFFNPGVIVFFT